MKTLSHKSKGRERSPASARDRQEAVSRQALDYKKYEVEMAPSLRDVRSEMSERGEAEEVAGATEELWTWGWGDGGRLGHGNLKDHYTPKFVSAFRNENVVAVSGGLAHTMVVVEENSTEEGKRGANRLYGFGFNMYGQLGLGNTRNAERPTLVRGLSNVKVKQVVCGESNTVVLSTTGIVYQWGLGKTKAVAKPERLEASLFQGQRVVKVASGVRHTLAVTGEGMLFSWGDGQKGQLGHPQLSKYLELPRLVDALRDIPVFGIAAGAHHSLVVTEDFSTVFSFGTAAHGELGHGDISDLCELPRPIKALSHRRIVTVSSCFHHSVAVADNGEVYAWGLGESGQLGTGRMDDVSTPELLTKFNRQYIREVSCGARHTVFLNTHGEIFTCGEARYGRLGHGDDEDLSIPTRVEGMGSRRVVLVSCGHAHTMAVSSIRADDGVVAALEEVQQQMQSDDEPRQRRNLFVPDPEGYAREMRSFIQRGRFTLDTMERWLEEVFPKTFTVDSVLDELLQNHLAHVKYMCHPPVLNEKVEEQKRIAALSSPSRSSHRPLSGELSDSNSERSLSHSHSMGSGIGSGMGGSMGRRSNRSNYDDEVVSRHSRGNGMTPRSIEPPAHGRRSHQVSKHESVPGLSHRFLNEDTDTAISRDDLHRSSRRRL